MASDGSPSCCSSEPCAGASGCATASFCPTNTTCLPNTCSTSRCQTPSFLCRASLPACCLSPCYLAGGCNSPCLVGSCAWCEEGSFNSNEKETMQFLNDRLASYLERVRSLEENNAELECRIREQCEPNAPLVCPDYQRYFDTIEELQQKILCTKAENSRLAVQVDNCKLAADDFRSKYESELSLRQLVENDITGLRGILGELTLCKSDLEAHVESMKDDLICLKKGHEEEVNLLREQLGDRLSVELDTAPTVDLNKVLDEMRCQYERVLANNRRDAEEWFAAQTEELNQQQKSSAEQLEGCQTEMLELKRKANTLEIELQAQQTLTESLECTVAETEAQYSTQLAQMQCLIDSVEHQLAEIRCDLERQNQEYQVLLDTKARLECEINTYRGLLEKEDSRLPCNPGSGAPMPNSTCEPCSNSMCEPCSAYVICTVENCCA
ncbi:keratin, type I cytoskeletal 40 isoform 1 [Mus musculus]|uniref:Keratin, type I cytoskeletal 40 n=1 Tax=Mus musculus TaxID=10090 RepID=K1C40_MOUSE|nr:keratin, type I cytoskeletal 40 isoform 1 [Mus musculus]Q6IFX3.1 RecName: Full=Keratin, type I cytoskeletal 40; AltName: Full=Cytokeratin-40; Short=CK-40; AltName: Full=Keratin-40; Short=K40; AltName: Full=Type I hair keratin Ka36 [Mus musculus]AAI19523.1 Keratin 40 [Mus musculus]DAA04490.1 TPA_exp: type I hair keratin KA36 [Mus musculus]|eukprot:NP_001034755.1 keratin, type I cytoskeletal 40 isoform 1 [Mus musculus]